MAASGLAVTLPAVQAAARSGARPALRGVVATAVPSAARAALLAAFLCAVVLPAAAQLAVPQASLQPGPGLAIVVHHPVPDAADPLGFPWPAPASASGSWSARMAHVDPAGDGFDFPTLVVDGIVVIEGPPWQVGNEAPANGPADPQGSTDAAYAAAVAARAQQDAPVTLWLHAIAGEAGVRAMAIVEARLPLGTEAPHLWLAIVEDPVHFVAPPAVSNGVEDHPFTLRALADLGPLDLSGGPDGGTIVFTTAPEWRADRLWLAGWVQSSGTGRFLGNEVLQASMHRVGATHTTIQETKGVLVEMLSATWCDPCLFGDRAVATLARTHGIDEAADDVGYARAPRAPVVAALGAVAGAWFAVRAGAWFAGSAGERERGP